MHARRIARAFRALISVSLLVGPCGCGGGDGNPDDDGGARDTGTRDADTLEDGQVSTDNHVQTDTGTVGDAAVTDSSLPMNDTLRAFPSAEGFGADATAGAGARSST